MLNRLALRLSTVRALRGATFAGPNVLDSEHGGIDELAMNSDEPQPYIVVHTDDGMFHGSGARDLFGTQGDGRVGSGFQKLIIEIGVTQKMLFVDEAGQQVLQPGTPVTDPLLEIHLDLIERQVYAALSDEGSEWAEVWRTFATSTGDRQSQRGASTREGLRFAGRQITLDVSMPRDPTPGDKIGPLWKRFIALAKRDPSLTKIVPLIEQALLAKPVADWRSAMRGCGLTHDEAKALLLQESA
jgi:hypothetical protein